MASPRPCRTRLIALLVVLSATCVPKQVGAVPEFPAMVGELLEMPCAPQCTICHRDNEGGFGTLRTTDAGEPGFGLVLRRRYGLDPADPSTLKPALAGALVDGIDVDADGAIDIYELADGTDPNSVADTRLCGPVYGCGARLVRGDGAPRAVLALLALLGLAARRR